MKPWKVLDPSKDKLTGAELQMGLLGTQLVCKLILAVFTRDVGGVNFAATMLEFSILWGKEAFFFYGEIPSF